MPCLRNLQPPQYASCTNAAVDNPKNTLALMTVCCQGHLLLMPWLLPYPTPTPPPQVWFCNGYWEGLMNKTGMLHASSAWVTSVTLTAPSKFTAPRLSPTIGHRQPTGLSAPFPGSPVSKPASCGLCAIPESRTRTNEAWPHNWTGSCPERMDQESSASELPQGDLQHALQIYA